MKCLILVLAVVQAVAISLHRADGGDASAPAPAAAQLDSYAVTELIKAWNDPRPALAPLPPPEPAERPQKSVTDVHRPRFDDAVSRFFTAKDADNWFKLVMPPRRGRFLRKQYRKLRADVENKSRMLAAAQKQAATADGADSYRSCVGSKKSNLIAEALVSTTRVIQFEHKLLEMISVQTDTPDDNICLFPSHMSRAMDNKESGTSTFYTTVLP